MNYWQLLAEARAALEAGGFRAAEEAFDSACSARAGDARRVFLSETLPDGARSLWRRLNRHGPAEREPGRWQRAESEFRAAFAEQASAILRRAEDLLDRGPERDPAAAFAVLDKALYLSVASRLVDRRLAAAQIVTAIFELLPATGRLCARDLVTPELDLAPSLRLRLAAGAIDGLGHLPPDDRADWAESLLALLAGEGDWSAETAAERDWVAANLGDRYRESAEPVLAAWRACDVLAQPEARRQWSCLRRLEILAGRDRRCLSVPRYGEAHHLAWRLPRDEASPLWQRAREALALVEYRQPRDDPPRGWLSAAAAPGGEVHLVFWWGAEPRDTATWRPELGAPAVVELLAAAGGRVVWGGDGAAAAIASGWPAAGRGRALAPYLEAVLEPLLPEAGWNDDLAHRLALARSGAWRDGWRAEVGHPLLEPLGQDGRMRPAQATLTPALETGLLWLAVLHRVDAADPALRAGLGELARRGDPAAEFVYECAVLGAPDKAATDANFAAWTVPLLWTRPDPLSARRPGDADAVEREDLAGQAVAVVTTGRPGRVLAAWGPGERRWRFVLDRLDRLGELQRQVRESYGPVTVVPPGGEVHDLDAALRLLDDLAAEAAAGAADPLALCHWIRLVETHNGDLLDNRVLRPRPAGACPLYDRYAARVAALPRRPAGVADTGGEGSWSAQYAQRVRRSGVVAGLVDDLPAHAGTLDAVWGVYDGSDASWVFLDSAAVHWRLHRRDPGSPASLHALLVSRGRRHLSLIGSPGLLREELAAWFDAILSGYGRPYHLDLGDRRSPRLRLAGAGPLPDARLAPGAGHVAALQHLRAAGAETVVRAGRDPAEAAFWRDAATGVFGPVGWRLGQPEASAAGARLVVHRLESLDDDAPPLALIDTPASWQAADRDRRQRLLLRRRLAALETGALMAEPVAAVDVLDGRWWRLLEAADAPPPATRTDGAALEIIDLAAAVAGEAARPLQRSVAAWHARAGAQPGDVPGWAGPALGDAAAVDAAGVFVHLAPAADRWRDLAADLLRRWEAGEPVARLLVVGDSPPAGAAAIVAVCGAAGASSLAPAETGPFGPLVWARPADLLACLGEGTPLPACERALVLDLETYLPPASATGARLLNWLAAGRIGRLDLAGAPLSPAWRQFLADRFGAQSPPAATEPGGWTVLRRGEVPHPHRLCPQCGQIGPGAVDGLFCSRCGYHFAGGGPRPEAIDRTAEHARRLLAQTDLGRDGPLEIWGDPPDLAGLRDAAVAAGARIAADTVDRLVLADGRRWQLRSLAGPRRLASGPAILLRPPLDPADLVARGSGEPALTLIYDRLDVASRSGGTAASAAERLLRLLRDPGWLDPELEADAPPGFAPTVSRWRLAWLAGVSPREVQRAIEVLRWVGVLEGALPLPDRPAVTGSAVRRLLVRVPVREMELRLAGCAARLEPTVASLLAGGLPGAWQGVWAPGGGDLLLDPTGRGYDAPAPDIVDTLLALAATWPLAGGGALVYAAPRGAWFSNRRRVGWLGGRERLVTDLVGRLDGFADWIRTLGAASSRSDRRFILEVTAALDPVLTERVLLGQELGFWNVAAPDDPGYLDVADLQRLASAPLLAPGSAASTVVADLAGACDAWRRRLVATPPGGTLVAGDPVRDSSGTPARSRSWWRRGDKDVLREARGAVSGFVAARGPGQLILAGVCGTGRTDALLSGLRQAGAAERAEIWCPDLPTGVRLHLSARRLSAAWQPELHVWRAGDPLPGRFPAAAGEPRLIVLLEAQRFPREVAYRLQELGREGKLLVTVDRSEVAGAWEDLFLVTPRRDEILELRSPVLPAQLPWRAVRGFYPAGLCDAQTQRRDRGSVDTRPAGTLDECAAALTAASDAGRLGAFAQVTAPLVEDVLLLARALADHGWAAVLAEDLAALMLPGTLELSAAFADAHLVRHGAWPAGEGTPATAEKTWLLTELVGGQAADDWGAWLRGLDPAVLDDAAAFLDRLRRSPWGPTCCVDSAARHRAISLAAAGRSPGTVVGPALWQAWRRQLADVLERGDLATGRPAATLAAASAPGGVCAESVAYVCFGSEPAAVHRRVLARATDRLLVLYQELSPLPGDRDQ
ncbi:MAG TPA: hypothetical protein PLL30_06375 [Candidatus Krumholzibacteria bacterium]|nr:hypothetical protein [Candidatus Krumholzibacteria bacterium]HPD71391.1 hypothetical protein [Candidatus Krumholzibacteria bacterium]HRY38909.1 hypothetical protein [Candidatus Krumholzibacteria bacterium]